MVDQVSKVSHTDSVRLGISQIFYTSKDSISFQFYPRKTRISRKFRKENLLHVKCLQIGWNHSTPSISGGKKSTLGRRLVIMAAFPRIRWREIFCISWLTTSLSSDPVCRARAAPRRLSWLTARWCIPPSVSRAMGRKTSPCCLQASAVSRIFLS